ncbi:hypothetical protein AX15_003649 [Amanita polypyramis BW_CC]|nr:hypothetical protein AX15_003649 [Amanita polypyramis BW_CC]
MASGDEQDTDTEYPGAVKKRRLYGACDMCRKKKIRCDSAIMPGNKCSNCIVLSLNCEHSPRRTKAQERESQKDQYIQSLEARLNKLEEALRSYNYPRTEILASPPLSVKDSFSEHSALHTSSPKSLMHNSSSLGADVGSGSGEAENCIKASLDDQFRDLTICPMDQRFFGQSSPFMLTKHAVEMKKEFTGDEHAMSCSNFRRSLYWELPPWERAYSETDSKPSYVYPETDLLYHLIDLYFEYVNLFLPLLHRPTFEKLVRQNFHRQSSSFGSCLLLVCAIASRHTDDPRVLLDEEVNTGRRLSSGWKYFSQVPQMRSCLVGRISLYDLQYYCLSVSYLLGCGVFHTAWNMLGLGIRVALEHGLHRHRRGSHKPTFEDELFKRAFWVFVTMDRIMSSFSGRPFGLHDEDFDIEPPVQCDDEYWEIDENSYVTFNQPPGKPSYITGFIAHLKLTEILAFAMRTLYSTRKTWTTSFPVDGEMEQRLVAEVDSAMNQWKDGLPDHLKWDPHREDRATFEQSAILHGLYYQLQIQIHRPFLQKESPLSLPSIVICTNAARSCARVLEVQIRRNIFFYPQHSMAAFVAGVILLLNLWIGKRAGVAVAPEKGRADLDRCLYVLETCEKRWHIAGRLWDVLHELATMRNELVPPEQMLSRKRPRQSQSQTVVGEDFVRAGTSTDLSNALSLPRLDTQHSPSAGYDTLSPSSSNISTMTMLESSSSPASIQDIDFNTDLLNIDIGSSLPAAIPEGKLFANYDAASMWYNVPMHFDVNDWDFFISTMNEFSQSTPQ